MKQIIRQVQYIIIITLMPNIIYSVIAPKMPAPFVSKTATPAPKTIAPKAPAPTTPVPAAKGPMTTLNVPFPIKVKHSGNTPITINGISIVYYFSDSKTPYTFTASSLNIATTPPTNSISFRLKTPVPLATGETGAPDTGIAISSITINNSTILLSPAWDPVNSGTDKIYVKTLNGKIVIDTAATKKAINALTNPSTPVPSTAPKTTVTTKTVATAVLKSKPKKTTKPKKSKAGKASQKAIKTIAS